jgi:hypothetical protein
VARACRFGKTFERDSCDQEAFAPAKSDWRANVPGSGRGGRASVDYTDGAQRREGKNRKQNQGIEFGRLDDGSGDDGGGPQNRGNDTELICWGHVALRFGANLADEPMVAREDENVGAPTFLD